MIKKKYTKIDTLAPKILTAQFLLFTDALLWLGFAVYLFADMLKAHNTTLVIFLISFFLLINVAALAFCGATFGRRDAWAYYFCLFVVIVNGVFTLFGQFEVFDLIALLFDILILIFLLSMARAYFEES